jgi:sigma-B regulation protein RsbU (phosphoserine phosphatase)
LPPFLVSGTSLRKLEEGGMVVGLFDEFSYEQGKIQVEPGSLLIAFSDGLTEPENAYGEQFGQKRLAEEVLRHRTLSLQRLTEQLFVAAEEWGGTPGQADDMTVLVARLS